ncbi:MAG: FAD-dependent oxidoreductase [Thiobacillaceae bacterium]|nr:FAD-dependent oxidoreductase [Thiobacillaceae bacterium]
MKIAIVGSGIAGLTAAHHLHPEHEITLFEAGGHVGGHVHTHDVRLGGRDYRVDTGFIVFNRRTYPHFIELLGELGVEGQDSDMSFSVSCGDAGPHPGLEYNGTSLNALFAQRENLLRPGFWGMLRDILRFNREAPGLLQDEGDEMSLGEYLARGGYGRMFRDYYILPMGAAIWSTDPERMLGFPARFFVRFFQNHGLLSVNDRPTWRVVKGGSRAYVDRLVRPFADRIRLMSPVQRIVRREDGVVLHTQAGGAEPFDAVFLACHSDQALALLAEPTAAEREVLSAIPYQPNEAVLHTDTRLLPRRRLAWAAWNYLMPEGPEGRLSLTYDMNLLQGLDAPETFCVTLNAGARIDPDKVIARMTYHHPLFTPEGSAAQARHREINGTRRTYYCGAWWRNGFHEDGLVSALDALRHFRQDFLHHRPPYEARRA